MFRSARPSFRNLYCPARVYHRGRVPHNAASTEFLQYTGLLCYHHRRLYRERATPSSCSWACTRASVASCARPLTHISPRPVHNKQRYISSLLAGAGLLERDIAGGDLSVAAILCTAIACLLLTRACGLHGRTACKLGGPLLENWLNVSLLLVFIPKPRTR